MHRQQTMQEMAAVGEFPMPPKKNERSALELYLFTELMWTMATAGVVFAGVILAVVFGIISTTPQDDATDDPARRISMSAPCRPTQNRCPTTQRAVPGSRAVFPEGTR